MTQKGWAVIAVMIILAVIVGGFSFFYYQNSSLKNKDRLVAILNNQVYNLQKTIDKLKNISEEGKKISVLDGIYENADYKFSVTIWPDLEITELKYDAKKVISGLLATYSVASASQIKASINDRWTLNIWEKTADDKDIAQNFSNLKFYSQDSIKIGNKNGVRLIYTKSIQVSGTQSQKFSLYVVRTGNFVYAISSKYCDQGISDECKQILENFKFN